jgi:hypothetical protein
MITIITTPTNNILSSPLLLLLHCALLILTVTTTFTTSSSIIVTAASLPEKVFWDNNDWPSDLILPRKAGDSNNEDDEENYDVDLWSPLSSDDEDVYVISGQISLNEIDNDQNSEEMTDIFNTNNGDGGVGKLIFRTYSFVFAYVCIFPPRLYSTLLYSLSLLRPSFNVQNCFSLLL